MEETMSAKGGSAFGGKIAIQAADLDYDRIDGTRVYIINLLKYFGKLDKASEFLIYHKNQFNPELTPPNLSNYKIKKIKAPFLWTQLRFAWELSKDKPDVLWMPMHNIPFIRNRKMKTVVTVHDLAYKYFPDYFPKKDLCQLNFLGSLAINSADRIIAISESTKKDVLKFYPKVKEEKIRVIHHGFDAELFRENISEENIAKTLQDYNLKPKSYILYSGAIQPRKNLKVLIEAFEIFKEKSGSDFKLVLAGEKAWFWEDVLRKVESNKFKEDIIMTGKLKFCDLKHIMGGAGVYVYPSLYEGFGIPVLEAMASGIAVITTKNSSLPEVGGEAVLYFDSDNANDLAEKIKLVLSNEELRNDIIAKGWEQIKKFSWEKCARETLEYIKE